jgi:hypothetical protein
MVHHSIAVVITSFLTNFVITEFYEVRYELATPSNGKDTPFEGCARTHDLGTVSPKSGQRLGTASRRRWAPRGRGETVVQPAVLNVPEAQGEKGVLIGVRIPPHI